MTIKRQTTRRELPDVVIITGLSGSGMSSATNAFEDLGYFCVDNLPVTLLPTFARLLTGDEKTAIERAALVINIRERQFLDEFPAQLEHLTEQGLRVSVLFLEAADDVLQRRFSETRRPHPADGGNGLRESIEREREAMQSVRELADLIIDTSEHTVHTLRRLLIERFNPEEGGELPLRVQILSFGHKYGAPRDLDLLFDVRHLPNPYFVPDLRHFSGSNPRVIKFLREQNNVTETIERFLDLLKYLLPFYKREGKSYLSVGIGCTGGRHRSVMVANTLGRELRRAGYEAQVTHRDIKKAAKRIG
jgi:RNase adapter protein RapZ